MSKFAAGTKSMMNAVVAATAAGATTIIGTTVESSMQFEFYVTSCRLLQVEATPRHALPSSVLKTK